MPTTNSADGTRLEYDRAGAGPTVVMINAGPTDRNSNAEVAALLADQCTVINYDRRGRGGSGDTAPYHPDREVEDLQAIVDAAGGEVGLFGNSGGVFIALRAAAAGGMPISRIALWEPPFAAEVAGRSAPRDYLQRLRDLAGEGRAGDMAELFLTEAVGLPPEFVAGIRQSPYWPAVEQNANPALVYDAELAGDFTIPRDRAAGIGCPVLVLDGGTEPWLTEVADVLAAALPKGERQTLPGQPHNVAASALAPALGEFFGNLSYRSRPSAGR